MIAIPDKKILDRKITAFASPVSSLPDRPQLSAEELKAVFDSNTTNELKAAVNGVIDDLSGENGAANIGYKNSTVAEMTLFKDNEAPFTPSARFHPATKAYVDEKVLLTGAADMTQAVYDQDSNGIVDNAERLGGELPEYYARKTALIGYINKQTGQSVSFNSLTAGDAITNLTAYGHTTETGTGTKSPDNPYTLSGVDEVVISDGGGNSQTITLPQTLYSLPNGVRDEYDVRMGSGTRRAREIVFDGSEDEGWSYWGRDSGIAIVFRSNALLNCFDAKAYENSPLIQDRVYASHFHNVGNTNYGIADENALWTITAPSGNWERLAIMSNESVGIRILKSRLTGWDDSLTNAQKVTLFKTWLSSNPITVLYELATPQAITGEPQELPVYIPNTTISVTSGEVYVEISMEGWYKAAEQTCSSYTQANITFAVNSAAGHGILELQIFAGPSAITEKSLKWQTRNGLNTDDFIIVISGLNWSLYAKTSVGNPKYAFEIAARNSDSSQELPNFIFQNNETKEATDPVAAVISSDGDFFVHSLTGTVHALTGILPTSGTCELTFKATAGYTYGDTFTLNNTVYTALKANGTVLNTDDFIAGAIVSVNVDVTSKKLFFKLGGISAGMYANHQFFAANGTFTVPKTGKYHIVCAGSGGDGGTGDNGTDDYGDHWWAMGGSGGSGAVAIKDVVLTAGQTVNITAGARSSASFGNYCTGGGGGRGGSGGHTTSPSGTSVTPIGGSAGSAGSASGGDTNYPGCVGDNGRANWYPDSPPPFIYGALPTANTELTLSDVRTQFGSWDTFGVMPSGFPMCSEGAGADSTSGSPWNYYRGAIGGVLVEWN